jgi:hypothetical protein
VSGRPQRVERLDRHDAGPVEAVDRGANLVETGPQLRSPLPRSLPYAEEIADRDQAVQDVVEGARLQAEDPGVRVEQPYQSG